VLAETAASAGFSLVSMLVIGRVIGPAEAGIGAVAIAAFLLLDVFGAALFPDALVHRPGLSARHIRSALTAAVLLGVVSGAILIGLTPLLTTGTGQAGADQMGSAQSAMPWLLLALAPLLPFSAFSGTASGVAMRGQRFRLLALRVLIGQPLALGAGLAAAMAGFGAWAMVINQAAATGIVFLLFLVVGRVPLRPAFDIAALRELWPVALPQLGAVVLIVGKYRIFLLALGFIMAEVALAQAHFAFRMVDAALFVVWGAVARIAMPRLCALQHDREALARCYGEIAQLPALIGLPLALGIALVADDMVGALLGPAWAGTADAARIVALAATVTFLHGDHFSLFVACDRAKRNMLAAGASLAVPLLVLIALRPETAAGAALAWSTQSLVVTPVLAWLVMRELRCSPLWLLRHAAPGLCAGAAMVPAVLLVQGGLADAAPLLRLVAAGAVGAVVFGGVAWLALGRRLPAALIHREVEERPSQPAPQAPPQPEPAAASEPVVAGATTMRRDADRSIIERSR
jgi:PST family polysaccharide transporter